MRYSYFARALADSILAGGSSTDAITSRLTRTLGRSWPWLRPLVLRYRKNFPEDTRPSRNAVVAFLLYDQKLRRARSKHRDEVTIAEWVHEPGGMQPVPAATTWDLPAIDSVGALANWLGIAVNDLLWLADLKGLGHQLGQPFLEHYHYRILQKPSGQIRLIEIPKPRLKEIQRKVLSGILDKIPSHPAAHGFVKNRSIRTFAAPHVRRPCLLRMDLQDFFPTFSAARVSALFRIGGYPESVAALLAGFCTNAVARKFWTRDMLSLRSETLRAAQGLYAKPHLPQGAPTSPSLANICSYRLDCRLSGLAASEGVRYTRYADDLAFSGGDVFARKAERFSLHAAAILMEEGFQVNHRKTRVMRQGVRQHLAGLVANQKLNVPRPDYDRLKATLTNCRRHGPQMENRDGHPMFRSHLEGQVAFVESVNPLKGARLRSIFQQISWSAPSR